MTLWFVLALMTAAAVFAVLWPLGRRVTERSGGEIAVYRDQLKEIERDRASGLLPPNEAEAARIEVSRRLLAAADTAGQAPAQPASGPLGKRVVAVCALVLLPLLAAGTYLVLGAPNLPGEPLYARARAQPENRSIESLVSQVEAHIERNPDDGRGWEVLAPVYLRLGRFDDAVKARRKALDLNGETAERQADLGEALVMAANGIVTADAKSTFERALSLDAKNPKSNFFVGLAAEQDGKRAEAVAIWKSMLAGAPAEAPWLQVVRDALARVEGAQPGPSASDIAEAAKLSSEQQKEMVTGMVVRLAERLKNDGSDVEGWLRLVRAYVVLGERDKALAAAGDARRALASDADKLRRVDELVKGLGLEG